MPLTRLIFFPEPRELTDEQYAEALALGHVREDVPEGAPPASAGPMTGGGTGTVTSTDGDAGASGDDDDTDEQGA
jgi:hypothetical protein